MKFHGKVGFWIGSVEVTPGVFKSDILEKDYYGDVLDNKRRFQEVSDQQNDDLNISNRISILSDLYMQQHWPSIKYVIWNGVSWKVTDVDISYPRIILTIGGVYNGKNQVGASPNPM